jgi:peptide chain release factor subunit 1
VASTINWDTLRQLAAFRAEQGCAVSLYVDLDPSETPTAGDAMVRVRSLVDEGLKSGGAVRAELTHDQREGLRDDFERISRYFDDEFDRDGARALAVFCAGLDKLWRPLALAEPVPDHVQVGRDLYLAPLVPLVGRGGGAIVGVVSREQGRLYRLRDGKLVDLADVSEEQPGRHDQGGWSQANYQRHIENLVHEHLKTVALELAQAVHRDRSVRVVLVCPQELRGEFEGALPNDVRAAVVGWTQAEAHASPADLLAAALPELERAAAAEEAEVVERWREEAGRNGRAASGWEETLEAASDGRVDLLVFAPSASRSAWQCPSCGRVNAGGGRCPLDGVEMEQRDDGLDLAVHQTLVHGGSIRALRVRDDLQPVEGIGALLRF